MKIYSWHLIVMLVLLLTAPFATISNPSLFPSSVSNTANTNLDLTSSLLDFLINQSNFSWDEIRSSTNNSLYFGVSGLAGIGLQLINSVNLTTDSNVQNKIQVLEIAIADYLYSNALIANSTDLYWSVHEQNTTLIDLGYEFGLSGIATFYAKLAVQTQNSTYTEYAFRILSSLIDLASTNSTDIYWKTTLNDIYAGVTWFHTPEIPHYLFDTVTFLGQAYGTLGLATATLDYLTAPSADQAFGESILTRVLHFQNRYLQENTTKAYLPMTVEYPELIDFSEGFGLSGMGNVLLNVASYQQDTSYISTAMKIIHYLNTTSNGAQYYFYTRVNQHILDTRNYEMGIKYGIAGTLDFFVNYYQQTNDTDVVNVARKLAQFIDIFKSSAPNGISFPERVTNSKLVHSISTSFAYGTVGIVLTLKKANTYLNVSSAEESYTRAKNYIKSATTRIDSYYLVSNPNINYMDYSVNRGSSGVLQMLLIQSSSLLQFSKTSIDFGTVELSKISTQNISITNVGEQSVLVNVGNITTPFTTDFAVKILNPQSSVTVAFGLNTANETTYDGSALIFADNIAVQAIYLHIKLFDYPSIKLTSLENNSVLSGYETFIFAVSDASAIKSIVIYVYDAEHQLLESTKLSILSPRYLLDTTQYTNGTYYVKIQATDIFDYSTSIEYTFTFANAGTNLLSNVDSNYILYIVVTGIILVSVAILLRMRKYK